MFTQMRSNLKFLGTILFTLVFLMGGVLTVKSAQAASETVYDALPSVSPATSYPSQPFQAQQVTEFGDLIHLSGTNRVLDKVTVTMSDYALSSTYSSDTRYNSDPVNWTHPITLNIYSTHLGANGAPDTLLDHVTQTITIPWRPLGDDSCPIVYDVHQWRDGGSICRSGYAFNATFDLSSLNLTLPDEIIVGVAFNTQSYGVTPIGLDGPYKSLNVVVGGQTVNTGSNNVNSVFLNSTLNSAYASTGTYGIFREDTSWGTDGTVAMQITATPFLVTNGSNGYSTIQAAINAATSGNTINVAAGTYIEQLTINKNLTLIGAGDTTIIQSPNTLDSTFTATVAGVVSPMKPIITVDGADVNISALKVDGNAKGDSVNNTFFVGIGFYNAGGSLDHVTVTGVKEALASPDYQGDAVRATNTIGSPRTLSLTNNTISDFQKNGITLSGSGLTVTVSDNHVTGIGANVLVAQNGIVLGTGVTGSVTNNTVKDLMCNYSTCGSDWYNEVQAIAIALVGAGSKTVSGNTVSNSDIGIYSELTSGVATITNNILTGNRWFGMLFEKGDVAVSGGSVTGGEIGIFNSSNRNTGTTTVHNVNLSGNTTAVQNDIVNFVINATQNYWGNTTGPVIDTDIKGVGKTSVEFNPWFIDVGMTTLSNAPKVNHGSSGSYTIPAVPAKVETPDGCEAGNKFSTTTGRNCNAATPAVGKVLGAEKFNFTKFLKFNAGSYKVSLQGDEVIELQNFLTTLGYDLGTADGKFGPKTKGAVIKFQIANGLKGDGIVGALTRAALNK